MPELARLDALRALKKQLLVASLAGATLATALYDAVLLMANRQDASRIDLTLGAVTLLGVVGGTLLSAGIIAALLMAFSPERVVTWPIWRSTLYGAVIGAMAGWVIFGTTVTGWDDPVAPLVGAVYGASSGSAWALVQHIKRRRNATRP